MQASYGVVKLNRSVPINKAINVLIDTLNNNKKQLQEHTKLTLIAQISGTLSKQVLYLI